MKYIIFAMLALLYSSMAQANHSGLNESDSAENNANCNAAFNLGCPSTDLLDQSYTASSSGFAAPAGVLGSSPQELTLIILLLAGMLFQSRSKPEETSTSLQSKG